MAHRGNRLRGLLGVALTAGCLLLLPQGAAGAPPGGDEGAGPSVAATLPAPAVRAWVPLVRLQPWRVRAEQVTHSGRGFSAWAGSADLSADGRYLVFTADAADVWPDGEQGLPAIFLRDLVAGQTKRISPYDPTWPYRGASRDPAISGDGSTVTYTQERYYVPAPGDGYVGEDALMLADVATGSSVEVTTGPATKPSWSLYANVLPSLTHDGRLVAFARLLVHPPYLQRGDVMLLDREAGALTPIVFGSGGTESTFTALEGAAKIAADGARIVFARPPRPEDPARDPLLVYAIFDRTHLTLQDWSVTVNSAKVRGVWLGAPTLSADGRTLALAVDVSEPGPRARQVYLVTVSTGAAERVPIENLGLVGPWYLLPQDLSSDGRYLLLEAQYHRTPGEPALPAQVYLYDRESRRFTLISAAPDGSPANADCRDAALAADAMAVAFFSSATNLAGGGIADETRLYIAERAW